jgi:hypothetical protein
VTGSAARDPGHLSLVVSPASRSHGPMTATGTADRSTALATVDLAMRERLPRACPMCGAPGLEVRAGGERAVLGCGGCGGSWVVELGYLVPLGAAPPERGYASSAPARDEGTPA